MKRLKLSRCEKRLLRTIALGVEYPPEGMSKEAIICAATELERVGLIKAAWASGHEYIAGRLTEYGKAYMLRNPHLHNPIDWKWIITTIIAVATFAVALAALLTACRMIN